jgi:hypothetical protein
VQVCHGQAGSYDGGCSGRALSLDLECLDRIYLNGYMPNLQVGGQVVQFLTVRGFRIPSPAVVGRIGDGFRRSVRSFADANQIPIIRFAKGDRKIDKMRRYLAWAGEDGLFQVAAIAGPRSSSGWRRLVELIFGRKILPSTPGLCYPGSSPAASM